MGLALLLYSHTGSAQNQTSSLPQNSAVENCSNGIDDDGDGYIDCYDPDCACFEGVDCSTTSLPSEFRARLAWQSAKDGPAVTATPVVANMNPQQDSMPEIIVGTASGNGNITPTILQFYKGDGSNLDSPKELYINGGFQEYPTPSPAIGDINKDGIPELVMSCQDGRIRVYSNYDETANPPMSLWCISNAATELDYEDQRPSLADFDGDGVPEIYTGSDIWKFTLTGPGSPSLTKVINGPNYIGQAHYSYWAEGTSNPTAVDLLSVADCGGDPDCAGLELAAGPVIYSVDLDNGDGDGYQIKVKRDLNQMALGNGFEDGYTAVADVDLDGVLDVVVSSEKGNGTDGVYVWNKNGLLAFMPYPNGSSQSGSLPSIANLYDDRTKGYAKDYPEILVCNSYNLNCFNLHAAQANPLAPFWWSLITEDWSGFTGATTYDFNGDSIFEVVYRDEDNFRILYGGAAPFPPGVDNERNWFKMPCGSLTSDEYPVIADVDNDGETEIAVTGYTFSGYNTPFSDYRGRLRVFESDAKPWLPCRNVWNQYNYFIVNVNDNLTIPKQQQLHHLEMPAVGSGNRPLNRYLSQRPLWDEHFQPFIPLPDAQVQVQDVRCAHDSLQVELRVCNDGSSKIPAGMPIAFYAGDPTAVAAPYLGKANTVGGDLAADSCRIFSVVVSAGTDTLIYGVVNDDGTKAPPFAVPTDFPLTDQPECEWANNLFQFTIHRPQLSSLTQNPLCADSQDGSIELWATGGTAPLSFTWSNAAATEDQIKIPAGNYTVTVSDAKNCQIIQPFVLLAPTPLLSAGLAVENACPGEANGAVAFLGASQATPPYSLLWSTANTTDSLSNLPAGTYDLTITDAHGCSLTETAQVTEFAAPAVSPAIADISCFGENDGSIDLNLSGGTAGFGYAWSNGLSTQDLQQLAPGDYTLTLTYADGRCAQNLDFQIQEPPELTLSSLSQNPLCAGNSDGNIDLSASGGTPPFQYAWSTGPQTEDLAALPEGAYSVTVSDAHGCSQVLPFNLIAPLPLSVNGILAHSACPGVADGGLEFLGAMQGTPPYGLLWSTGNTEASQSGLATGAYTLTVTDSHGCSLTQTAQVPVFDAPTVTPTVQDVDCFGAGNGSIAIGFSGGAPGFGFQWSNGPSTQNLQNLVPGPYALTMTFADGQCARQFDFQIAEPPAIALSLAAENPLCAGGADGSITLSANGGSPPFQYLWSNGETTANLSDLSENEYLLTVTDSHGCTQLQSASLVAPLPLLLHGILSSAACPGVADGTLEFLGAEQGTPPYALQWSTGNGANIQTGLATGAYALTLTDAHGCSLVQAAAVPEHEAPVLSPTVHDVVCFGENNGNITVAFSGGTPGFGFNWSNGLASQNLQNLAPGAYALTMTFANGQCSQHVDFQIKEPPDITLSAASTPAGCNGGAGGTLNLSPAGGTPPFGFAWSNAAASEDLSDLPTGNYSATVTDAHGCTSLLTQNVGEYPAINLAVQVLHPRCFDSNDGSCDLNVSGGTPPFSYSWSNGGTTEDLSGLVTGNYSATVTDATGCTSALSAGLAAPEQLDLQALTAADTCQSAQGAALVAGFGGVPPYAYAWETGATTAAISGLSAGNYALTLTDAHGCSWDFIVHIPAEGLIPSALPWTDTLTCIQLLAQIGVTADQDNLHYSWTGPGNALPDQPTQDVSLPGLYAVTATNASGCQTTASISVAEDRAVPTAEAGAEQIDVPCDKSSALLDATGSSTGPLFQQTWLAWPDGAAAFDTSSLKMLALAPGVYVHAVLNTRNGCQASDTVRVSWAEPIIAALQVDSIRCFGDDDGRIALNLISGGTPPLLYSIDGQSFSAQPVFANLPPGDYPVSVRDNQGCLWESWVYLEEPPQLSVQLVASDTSIELGHFVQLQALPSPANAVLSDIVWEPSSEYNFEPQALRQRVRPQDDAEFSVEIFDRNGCPATDRVRVSVYDYHIWAPNVIYPGHGDNGWFTLFAAGDVKEVRLLRIHDRWGELLFEKQHFEPNIYELGWDGSFRGEPMNPGVFVWYAEVEVLDGRVFFLKGDVTVVR